MAREEEEEEEVVEGSYCYSRRGRLGLLSKSFFFLDPLPPAASSSLLVDLLLIRNLMMLSPLGPGEGSKAKQTIGQVLLRGGESKRCHVSRRNIYTNCN